jgi:hypothetical protein
MGSPAQASSTASEAAPTPTASPPSPKPTAMQVTHDIRVTYANTSIDTGLFRDTLTWQVDVCTPDKELLKDETLSRVRLYLRQDDTWIRQPATAEAALGGRCQKGSVNLTIPQTERAPAGLDNDTWTTCSDYRAVLPETKNFARTTVDFCQQVRQREVGSAE